MQSLLKIAKRKIKESLNGKVKGQWRRVIAEIAVEKLRKEIMKRKNKRGLNKW